MLSRTISRSIARASPPTAAAARRSQRLAPGPSIAYSRSVSSSSGTPQEVKYVEFGDSGWRGPFQGGKWSTRIKVLMGAAVVGSGYYVYHLERVEETGRWRFMDVTPKLEQALAQISDDIILKRYRGKILSGSDPRTRQVTRVAKRIITAAKLGEVKGGVSAFASRSPWSTRATQKPATETMPHVWEVFVIQDDNIPNAFVTRGGKIFVFTGILPIAKNDDGLATILGHEIAHRVERHSAEKESGLKVFAALYVLLRLFGLGIGISRVGLTLGMILPNSRTIESEADKIGLKLMSQACFDPRESVRVWERFIEMEKKKGGKGWFPFGSIDFFQTHPASEKRIKALSELVPQALSIRAASNCAIDDSRSVVDKFAVFKRFFGW